MTVCWVIMFIILWHLWSVILSQSATSSVTALHFNLHVMNGKQELQSDTHLGWCSQSVFLKKSLSDHYLRPLILITEKCISRKWEICINWEEFLIIHFSAEYCLSQCQLWQYLSSQCHLSQYWVSQRCEHQKCNQANVLLFEKWDQIWWSHKLLRTEGSMIVKINNESVYVIYEENMSL